MKSAVITILPRSPVPLVAATIQNGMSSAETSFNGYWFALRFLPQDTPLRSGCQTEPMLPPLVAGKALISDVIESSDGRRQPANTVPTTIEPAVVLAQAGM